MSENEIMQVYNEGINTVVSLVKGLSNQITDLNNNTQTLNSEVSSLNGEISSLNNKIEDLSEKNKTLEERIKTLESQINKNSKNSSKPPSSDGFKKTTKSLRENSTNKPGGQSGHKGHTLDFSTTPDHIVVHDVTVCSNCGESLESETVTEYSVLQVFELPKTNIEVTEHRVAKVKCSCCGHINKGAFPEEVSQPVQYGPHMKAVIAYLSQYQLLPYERISELSEDLFGQPISQGTLVNINDSCYEKLEQTEGLIKDKIIHSDVVHFDETGCAVNGKRRWLHVASTGNYTFYGVHKKRGTDPTDKFGILPEFEGIAVHDHWKPYFKYESPLHTLCNAHHLRELNGIIEFQVQDWAKNMKELLLQIKKSVENNNGTLASNIIAEYASRYDTIISAGYEEDSKKNPSKESVGKRGRKKQSKAKNLLDRLYEYKYSVLGFMYDRRVPFDNNQAERDIRMTKVHQKISGGFRSEHGAEIFCRIRGYISTVRKNGINVLDALETVFISKPILP